MSPVVWPAIPDIAEAVNTGKVTAASNVQRALEAIKEHASYNVLISDNPNALAQAEALDEAIASGKKSGRLAGVPFIVKDNILVEGLKTTAASDILGNFVAPYTSSAINKLLEEGAIVVGKANLDAFGHGSSTENSNIGATLNPHDKTRVSGGSSGGSAASVVLGLTPFAIGTDTGGSIRLPASYTGAVGLKPTYGLVSRYGVIAMASSTDTVGPLALHTADAAYVLDVMSGRDPLDSTTIERNEAPYMDFDSFALAGKKIGVIEEQMGEGVDEDVKQAINQTLECAKKAGADVKTVSIKNISRALAVYYIVIPAEISSNLSRYDGIRYGLSDESATTLDEVYSKSRSNGFNSENKRRIILGTYVLSSGYYDAYYKKAQTVRTLLIREFNETFADYDFLVGPVSPSVAFTVGSHTSDPLKMYLEDVMTVAPSLVGIPALSLPIGRNNDNMPIGMQIMAPARHDHDLLACAHELENLVGYK